MIYVYIYLYTYRYVDDSVDSPLEDNREYNVDNNKLSFNRLV